MTIRCAWPRASLASTATARRYGQATPLLQAPMWSVCVVSVTSGPAAKASAMANASAARMTNFMAASRQGLAASNLAAT